MSEMGAQSLLSNLKIPIYILRKCLLPLRNPLTIENLPVYYRFEDAYKDAEIFMKINKLTIRDNVFDSNNRYYVYEDFIGEQFIWIERHELKI